MSELLKLERDSWYGWIMYPGYGLPDLQPYHSPIRVHEVRDEHEGTFELMFGNLGYAGNGASMGYRLKPLRHQPDYLLAEVVNSNRSVAIMTIDKHWITRHHPIIADLVAREKERAPYGTLTEWLNRVASKQR